MPGRDESDAFEDHGQGKRVFLWAGSDDPRTGIVHAADIRPGDVLVVPSDYGGCDAFGWAPASDTAVADVADDVARPFRGRRHIVRIARNDAEWGRLSLVLATEGDGPASELGERCLDALSPDAAPEPAAEDTDVAASVPYASRWRRYDTRRVRIALHFPYAGDRRGGVVFVAAQGLRDEQASDLAAPATEDETHSRISSRPIALDDHGRRVARLARRFAETLRLPEAMVEDLSLAALLHDAGKADGRFRIMLSGGDPWSRPDGPPPPPPPPLRWPRADGPCRATHGIGPACRRAGGMKRCRYERRGCIPDFRKRTLPLSFSG